MQGSPALVNLSLREVLQQKVEQGFNAYIVQDFVLLSASKLGDGASGAGHASTGR